MFGGWWNFGNYVEISLLHMYIVERLRVTCNKEFQAQPLELIIIEFFVSQKFGYLLKLTACMMIGGLLA